MPLSHWAFGAYPNMAELARRNLLNVARESIISAATASLNRIHGTNPIPRIDYCNAIELAAEHWLKQHPANTP